MDVQLSLIDMDFRGLGTPPPTSPPCVRGTQSCGPSGTT